MKTQVAILHHEYPTQLRDQVVDRIQGLVRYFEGLVSMRAVLERQNAEHRVELVASVRRGVVLVVESRRDSIRAALDEAVDRMGRVLSRHKSKVKEHRKVRVAR